MRNFVNLLPSPILFFALTWLLMFHPAAAWAGGVKQILKDCCSRQLSLQDASYIIEMEVKGYSAGHSGRAKAKIRILRHRSAKTWRQKPAPSCKSLTWK